MFSQIWENMARLSHSPGRAFPGLNHLERFSPNSGEHSRLLPGVPGKLLPVAGRTWKGSPEQPGKVPLHCTRWVSWVSQHYPWIWGFGLYLLFPI